MPLLLHGRLNLSLDDKLSRICCRLRENRHLDTRFRAFCRRRGGGSTALVPVLNPSRFASLMAKPAHMNLSLGYPKGQFSCAIGALRAPVSLPEGRRTVLSVRQFGDVAQARLPFMPTAAFAANRPLRPFPVHQTCKGIIDHGERDVKFVIRSFSDNFDVHQVAGYNIQLLN